MTDKIDLFPLTIDMTPAWWDRGIIGKLYWWRYKMLYVPDGTHPRWERFLHLYRCDIDYCSDMIIWYWQKLRNR